MDEGEREEGKGARRANGSKSGQVGGDAVGGPGGLRLSRRWTLFQGLEGPLKSVKQVCFTLNWLFFSVKGMDDGWTNGGDGQMNRWQPHKHGLSPCPPSLDFGAHCLPQAFKKYLQSCPWPRLLMVCPGRSEAGEPARLQGRVSGSLRPKSWGDT